MYTNDERKQIAETILSQLGGNQFAMMTGAKNMMYLEAGLQFKIGTGAKDKINTVIVNLENDLYNVEFWKCGRLDFTKIKEINDVYAEDLRRIFTEATGFYCTFR